MQSQLKGIIIPENAKKISITSNEIVGPSEMGIELVRFDDEDKKESSVKVSMALFLEPWKQSEPIFG